MCLVTILIIFFRDEYLQSVEPVELFLKECLKRNEGLEQFSVWNCFDLTDIYNVIFQKIRDQKERE